MVKKVLIGSFFLIVLVISAFIYHIPVASDNYPKDLSVAQYIENYSKRFKEASRCGDEFR